ncbi:MAG: hypothetical protein HZA32_10625 [Opitutae bacterium]|nr:hypothetical protein [Opitutae bacterium]
MRRLSPRLLPLLAAAFLGSAHAAGPNISSLNPAKWHAPTATRSREARDANDQLRTALRSGDRAAVDAAVRALRSALGRDVSVPEAKTDYLPPSADALSLDDVEKLWLADCAARVGREPWDAARAALQAGHAPERLRDSVRMIEAYFDTARLLEDAAAAEKLRARALDGLRYLQSVQTKSGAFGYPYDAARTDRLGQMAAERVAEGQRLGRTMTEGVWMIEDLDHGDLQFDNGVCGLALLSGYALTHDATLLDSARRAGEWAMQRPLVTNWNYNAFSARLLARLYLVTRESRYLDAARRKFELGVLPGQTETGRWLDPHNARTQYHSILATALADYVEALAAAHAPEEPAARRALELALDNLAAQTRAFGPSNVHEMLPVEALARGLAVCGDRVEWRAALIMSLRSLTPAICQRFAREVGHLPEPIPLGLRTLLAR